uniref:Uncharacterized protein n=1 Tax=Arundo donax TaxID=35708 RepID=A0A0A9EXN9_ARUDO
MCQQQVHSSIAMITHGISFPFLKILAFYYTR